MKGLSDHVDCAQKAFQTEVSAVFLKRLQELQLEHALSDKNCSAVRGRDGKFGRRPSNEPSSTSYDIFHLGARSTDFTCQFCCTMREGGWGRPLEAASIDSAHFLPGDISFSTQEALFLQLRVAGINRAHKTFVPELVLAV